jgi:hypothetical protein
MRVTRHAMSSYVTRSGKPLYVETPLWNDVEPQRLSLTVDEHRAVNTGLVTRTGEPIMRVPQDMGFHRAGTRK